VHSTQKTELYLRHKEEVIPFKIELAKKHLQDAEKDLDVIDKMKEQYKKNKFLNPYRMKNMYNMQTVGQIMMNLDKKEITIRMDNEMGEFVGIDNRLPKGYEPKISAENRGEENKYKIMEKEKLKEYLISLKKRKNKLHIKKGTLMWKLSFNDTINRKRIKC
jgi:hypothetical protein